MSTQTQLEELKQATHLAMAGQWDAAHNIAQASGHPVANWIHAVLHKIEPDEGNSRYWYARTTHRYEEYETPEEEWQAILAALSEL